MSVYIAGDWGTTQLRLYLCDGAAVLDRARGPGIGAPTGPPEDVFASLIAGWAARHKGVSAHLCGMVGSRNGWVETPYVRCPADLNALRAGVLKFESKNGVPVSIVPGLSCMNPLDAPDVMRGEETQIFGALVQRPVKSGERMLCALPGTHTKWAVVEGGKIRHFLTAPTGEVFALLRDHSTLARAGGAVTENSAAGFMRGLMRQSDTKGAALTHLLFETRSRQLLEGLPQTEAMGFLSGLLVGADVSGALQWLGQGDAVTLIGDPGLTSLYARALSLHNVAAVCLDGEQCALAGLRAVLGTVI